MVIFFQVKIISFAGQKVSLSMKDVCQETGKDLNPTSHDHLKVLFILLKSVNHLFIMDYTFPVINYWLVFSLNKMDVIPTGHPAPLSCTGCPQLLMQMMILVGNVSLEYPVRRGGKLNR